MAEVPPVAVRRYRGDVSVIAELDRECFPGDDPLNMAAHEWWVALTPAGKIVGYAGRKAVGGGIYLSRCGILPRYRGHRLQARLIRARLRGCTKTAFTYTHPDNPASMRSLIACGFKPYSPEWAWAGREFVYWIK